MKYASFKMWIADKYHYKDGYAIWLVVRKDNKRKVMALGIYGLYIIVGLSRYCPGA